MTNLNDIKNQAKKAYKFDVGRNAGVEFIAFTVKFAPLLTLFTIYIICLTKILSPSASVPAATLLGIVFLMIYLFIIGPVNLGRNYYFTRVADGVQPPTDELFHFYRNLKSAVYAYFRIAIAVVFFSVLFIALTIIYFRIHSLFSSSYFSVLNIFVCLLIIAGYITCVIVTRLKYSLLPVTYHSNDSMSAIVFVAKTLRNSHGVKTKLFKFYLGFTGWYLLGVLSLGIGFIWIMPYIRIASKLYLKEIIN